MITVVYTLLDSELLCSPCPQERATTDNGSLSSDPRSGGLQRTGGPKLWLLGGLQESEDAGNAGDREGQKGAKSPSLVGGGWLQPIHWRRPVVIPAAHSGSELRL